MAIPVRKCVCGRGAEALTGMSRWSKLKNACIPKHSMEVARAQLQFVISCPPLGLIKFLFVNESIACIFTQEVVRIVREQGTFGVRGLACGHAPSPSTPPGSHNAMYSIWAENYDKTCPKQVEAS